MIKKAKGLLEKYGLAKDRRSLRKKLQALLKAKEPKSIPEEERLDPEERRMLKNVMNLRQETVEDVMIPRADILAIPLNITYRKLMALMHAHPYTRYPVFGENLDDIKGMIHVKDIHQFTNGQKFQCKEIMQKVLFVPQSLEIPDLLMQMRAAKIPMAIVVDEFGGVDGLVTPWDIAQQILGEMPDDDIPEGAPELTSLEDGTFEADARLPIEEFEEKFGKILTSEEIAEDIDTIGGLVVSLAGRVPSRKEVISHESGVEFEIMDATPRYVTKILIRPPVSLLNLPLDKEEETPHEN